MRTDSSERISFKYFCVLHAVVELVIIITTAVTSSSSSLSKYLVALKLSLNDGRFENHRKIRETEKKIPINYIPKINNRDL